MEGVCIDGLVLRGAVRVRVDRRHGPVHGQGDRCRADRCTGRLRRRGWRDVRRQEPHGEEAWRVTAAASGSMRESSAVCPGGRPHFLHPRKAMHMGKKNKHKHETAELLAETSTLDEVRVRLVNSIDIDTGLVPKWCEVVLEIKRTDDGTLKLAGQSTPSCRLVGTTAN